MMGVDEGVEEEFLMHESLAVQPPRFVMMVIRALETVYWGVRDIVEGQTPPSVLELAMVAAIGLVLGFVFLACAAQALVVLLTVGLGMVWGVVLGIMVERLEVAQEPLC